MRMFTCLSGNSSLLNESVTKTNCLISKFNFKSKKRRSGPYRRPPGAKTPPKDLQKSFYNAGLSNDENVSPACGKTSFSPRVIRCGTPTKRAITDHYASVNKASKGQSSVFDSCYASYASKTQTMLSSASSTSSSSSSSSKLSRNARRRLGSLPLPPIPSSGNTTPSLENSTHECDTDYLPLSQVFSPLREDDSQESTLLSVGVYDRPPQRCHPSIDASTAYTASSSRCDSTQYESTISYDVTDVDSTTCDYVYPRAQTRATASSSTTASSTVISRPFDEAFVQSTGSLPHRPLSNMGVCTGGSSELDSVIYENMPRVHPDHSLNDSGDTLASSQYQEASLLDEVSQYTTSQYTASQYTASQYTTSQYTEADSSFVSHGLNSLALTDNDEVTTTLADSGSHDYYNVPKIRKFHAIPHDTLTGDECHTTAEIDVENVSHSSSASEFLGCMSFGVQSLLQKDLDGWYYLLTEELGRKKHLQAHTKTKPVLRARSQQNIPQINKAFEGLESIVITIQRGKNGFGFSFVDEFPPRVGRVDRASPAEQAGVKKGDFVIRINGQNVSRSTCEGVAHLVKKMNPQSLTLELQRDHVAAVGQTVEVTASGTQYPLHPSPPYNKRGVGTSTDHLYESIGDHHKENWVRGMYGDELMTDDETVYSQHDNTSQPGITSTPRPFVRSGHKTVNSPSACPLNKHESIHRLMSLELDFIDFMHYGIERYSRPLRHCIVSPHQHMTVFQNVEKLVTISEFHIKQIQDNASSVDSDTEDSQSGESSMFPNSVALIYQSKVHMLCQAYKSYADGLARSNSLLKELRKNRDFMSFIREPPSEDSQSTGPPTISAFINRPVQHIHELYAVLNEMFAATPLHSPDFSTLQQVVIKLSQCISTITGLDSAGRVDSLTSSRGQTGSQTTSSGKGSMASLTSCSSAETDAKCPLMPSSASMPSSSSMHSIDRDVLRVQERLVFTPTVPTFQLCQEARHLIYQGSIYRSSKGSWFKSQLLLFSDILLIVDEQDDGSLLVSLPPVFVQDIAGIEVNRKYASEFVLHLAPAAAATLPRRHGGSSLSSSRNTRTITLRSPSAQEKFVWQSLLEQRVAANNGSRLEHYGSMRDISNVKTKIIL